MAVHVGGIGVVCAQAHTALVPELFHVHERRHRGAAARERTARVRRHPCRIITVA